MEIFESFKVELNNFKNPIHKNKDGCYLYAYWKYKQQNTNWIHYL